MLEQEIKRKKLDSNTLYLKTRKFTDLCSEETPMVRRAVAIKIGEIAGFMDKVHVISDLLPVLKSLCQDE